MSSNKRSRRRNVRLHCEPKVAYGSQMEAFGAAVHTGLNWYRCPYCRKWHLTKRNAPRHLGQARRGGGAIDGTEA